MLVSLIITTFNRSDALLHVLKSVEIQTKLPNEVIIADDGSDNQTQKIISEFIDSSPLNIIYLWHKDEGFRAALARNKAIAKANSDYIILIDGDVVLHPCFVMDHTKNSKPGYFVQGSRVLLKKEKTNDILKGVDIKFSFFSKGLSNRKNMIHSFWLSSIFSTQSRHLEGIKTCNMAFFRQDCININGFNNDFEGWGREDSEFAVRLLNNRIKRKNLRFNAIQFHLFHQENSRKTLMRNDFLLEEAVNNKSIWCNNGISKFL